MINNKHTISFGLETHVIYEPESSYSIEELVDICKDKDPEEYVPQGVLSLSSIEAYNMFVKNVQDTEVQNDLYGRYYINKNICMSTLWITVAVMYDYTIDKYTGFALRSIENRMNNDQIQFCFIGI